MPPDPFRLQMATIPRCRRDRGSPRHEIIVRRKTASNFRRRHVLEVFPQKRVIRERPRCFLCQRTVQPPQRLGRIAPQQFHSLLFPRHRRSHMRFSSSAKIIVLLIHIGRQPFSQQREIDFVRSLPRKIQSVCRRRAHRDAGPVARTLDNAVASPWTGSYQCLAAPYPSGT